MVVVTWDNGEAKDVSFEDSPNALARLVLLLDIFNKLTDAQSLPGMWIKL